MGMESYKKLVRLYVPEPDFAPGKQLLLSDGRVHYLRNVMRKEVGDSVRVFNGWDGEWLATLSEINKKNVLLTVDQQLLEQKEERDIWLLASPIKKEPFDLMVEKACELGATRFVPVMCDHTVVHRVNRERLQAISVEAAEQCERLTLMAVEAPVKIKSFLESLDWSRNLIFCLERGEGIPPLPQVVQSLRGKPLAILIGPEGGFSDEEIEFIKNFEGVRTASLGPRVLRAETAMIAALATTQLLQEE